jgi:peroxiredoxin
MAKQLNPGDTFPNYTVPTTDGVALNIPADLKGEYAVVIFYRGIW